MARRKHYLVCSLREATGRGLCAAEQPTQDCACAVKGGATQAALQGLGCSPIEPLLQAADGAPPKSMTPRFGVASSRTDPTTLC